MRRLDRQRSRWDRSALPWLFARAEARGVSLGAWLVIACAVELVAFAIYPLFPLAPWVGPAVAFAALLTGIARLADSPVTRLRTALEYAAALGFFTWVTWVVWGFAIRDGFTIETGDHQIMIARAEAQVRALAAGRWLRWTNLVQGGDSLGDLYPIFTNLLLFVAHALVPEGTPFPRTYVFFIVFIWWFRMVATYALARRFATTPIALLLGAASGLDVGHDVMDGTWHGTLYWGMVHSNVALSVALLATALQVDLVRRPTSIRFVACALLVALTAFAHPLGILVMGVSLAAYVAAWLCERELRSETAWALVASGLGLLLAAAWILPFTYGQEHFGFSNAIGGIALQELGNGLMTGDSPTSSFGAWVGLAVVAVAASLVTRDPALVATGLTATVLYLLPALELMTESGGFTYLSTLLEGQQRRTLTIAKWMVVPSVAWLCHRAIGARLVPLSLEPRRVLTRAAVIMLLAAGFGRILSVSWSPLVERLRDQVKLGEPGRKRAHTGADYLRIFEAIKEARRRDPSPTPFRVAVNWVRELRHATWGEGFSNRVPVVDYVNASANFLDRRPRELSAQGFRDWNIRFLVTENPIAPFPGLTMRLQDGRFTLWEFDGYDDRFVVAPDGVRIRNLVVDEGRVEFDVAGAAPNGTDVVVRSAWYPRWRAVGAGNNVRPTPPHPGAKPRQDQILVHVRNGRTRLTCDGTFPREVPGYALSVIGLAGIIALGSGRRRARALDLVRDAATRMRELARRLLPKVARPHKLSWVLAAVGLIGLFVAYSFVGKGTLLLTPPFVPGVRVSALGANGESLGCRRHPLLGVHRCDSGVEVSSALGSTPVGDDSGEFAELWPAISVNYGTAKPAIELAFSRVDTRAGRIEVRYEAHGKVHVELITGGRTSESRLWWGFGKDTFVVPKSARPRDVVIRLKPEGTGSLLFQRRTPATDGRD